MNILKEISTLYEDQEDNLNALKYYKLYFENQRTNLKAYSDNKISKLKTNYEFHLKDKNLLEAQAEIDRLKIRDNRLTLIIGSIIATMIFFSLIYFYDRNFRMKKKKFDLIQQNLSKTKLKAQQLEQNQLQNELHKKQQNIADFSSIIKKNNEKSIALLDMLEEIDKIKNTDLGDKIDDIIKFSKSNFVDSKDQELLKKSVQRVNSEFYSKLDKRFNLSKNDKYLAGLIRLNMNNKEIASIKGISVNSAKMNRYRLKKKLQLNSETDIVIFLQTI